MTPPRIITDDPTMRKYGRRWWETYWRAVAKGEERAMVERHRAALAALDRHGADACSILDVGCGEAWFCRYLSNEAAYTGLDWSTAVLGRVRQRWPRARLIWADFMRWEPAVDDRWDWAVSFEMFEHMARPRTFVEKVLSVVRQGVVMSLPKGEIGVVPRREREILQRHGLTATEYHWATYERKDIAEIFPEAEIVELKSHIVFVLRV